MPQVFYSSWLLLSLIFLFVFYILMVNIFFAYKGKMKKGNSLIFFIKKTIWWK